MTEQPINHIDHIQAWLKSHGRDRFWLADHLNVHKRTADNWLSAGQSIPEAKLALIKRLMADDEAAELRRKQQLDPIAQVFSLEVDLPTFRAYSQAAKAQRLTLEEWSIAELNSAAEQWFAQGKPSPSHLFPPFVDSTLNERGAAQCECAVEKPTRPIAEIRDGGREA